MHTITILNFDSGAVDIFNVTDQVEDWEDFLVDKGYRLSNIQYLVVATDKFSLNIDFVQKD